MRSVEISRGQLRCHQPESGSMSRQDKWVKPGYEPSSLRKERGVRQWEEGAAAQSGKGKPDPVTSPGCASQPGAVLLLCCR